jgi:outer membrane protein assembly factor BamD
MIRAALLTLLVLGAPGWTHSGENIFRFAANSASADDAGDDHADQVASKQMEVARWYVGKRDYTAAHNRLKIVVTIFSTSRYVEEALAHLAEACLALGLASEARTAVAVLGRKFPNGQWSADAHAALASAGLEAAEDENSWISQAVK